MEQAVTERTETQLSLSFQMFFFQVQFFKITYTAYVDQWVQNSNFLNLHSKVTKIALRTPPPPRET